MTTGNIEMNEGDVAVVMRSDGRVEVVSAVTPDSLSGIFKDNIIRHMGVSLGVLNSIGDEDFSAEMFAKGMTEESIEAFAQSKGLSGSVN